MGGPAPPAGFLACVTCTDRKEHQACLPALCGRPLPVVEGPVVLLPSSRADVRQHLMMLQYAQAKGGEEVGALPDPASKPQLARRR